MLLLPGAEPFYFDGSSTGALLIHGFTGAQREVRPLGEALAAAGMTALGVRLAHHGTRPEDMFRSHRHDWLARSGHIVTEDVEREQVFDRVCALVRTHAPAPP